MDKVDAKMAIVNKSSDKIIHGGLLDLPKDGTLHPDMLLENLKKYPNSTCTRCKKDFAQLTSKSFKRCNHCRELQRLRTKRWQNETRQKEGVCSRCRTVLPDSSFSLCHKCRGYLRNNKETRLLNGKCVHCSAPNDESDVYKVCKKCRMKDKARRLTLEQEGLCIRCTSSISQNKEGQKVCVNCKLKKKSMADIYRASNENSLYPIDILPTRFNENKTLTQSNDHKQINDSLGREVKRKQQRSTDDECRKTNFTGEDVSVDISEYDGRSLEDKILESFSLHHDHAQLNQQLKRLTQYTNADNDSMDVDVSKYTDQSVLVDLHGLDEIDINYGIDNVNSADSCTNRVQSANKEEEVEDSNYQDEEVDYGDEDEEEQVNDSDSKHYVDTTNTISYGDSGKTGLALQNDSVGDDPAKESMLLHVRAIQDSVNSDEAEPSEADIAAAVEAVAAAAAAVVESSRLKD